MNKSQLAAELDLSTVTISRYISMGLPHEKVGGRYNFDLTEVGRWISDNIDSRQTHFKQPTKEEAIQWGFDMLERYVSFMKKCLCKGCHEKFMQHIESGKF